MSATRAMMERAIATRKAIAAMPKPMVRMTFTGRVGGEGEQAVVGQADEFAEVYWGAGVPARVRTDADLFVPDPGPQAADKSGCSGRREHVADDAPPHDAEVPESRGISMEDMEREEAVEGEVGDA